MTEIETASERGNTSRGSGRGRSRLIAEEPDVGLEPITPGSRPERRQTLNRCATQTPLSTFLNHFLNSKSLRDFSDRKSQNRTSSFWGQARPVEG